MHTYDTGRTVQQVYEELHSTRKYATGMHGAGTERFLTGFTSLLDVGCGRSPYLKHMGTQLGIRRIVGCDISPTAVAWQGLQGVEAVVADVTEGLPFSDGEFEVVCAWDFLEHMPPVSVDFVIRELARVARKRLLFHIAYTPAKAHGSLGEPLHLTIQPQTWWLATIERVLQVKPWVKPYTQRPGRVIDCVGVNLDG